MPQPLGPSPVRFAANGPISLAYQVLGEGPTTVLVVTGWVLPMESIWDDPAYARFIERLAADARVVLWDKRGTGMSDRVSVDRLPTLEQRMDDLGAVLDAVGVERATVLGLSEGAVLAALFAAAHPERTAAAVLYGGWASTVGDRDYPWMPIARGSTRSRAASRPPGTTWRVPRALGALQMPRPGHARLVDAGAAPRREPRVGRRVAADARGRRHPRGRPGIRAPTLVLHRAGDRIVAVENGRWLGRHVPGARYVELEGDDHLWWVGDQDALLREVEDFLGRPATGERGERRLATVMFTDIVGSTALASRLGDDAWRDVLARHDATVRTALRRFGGVEVKTLGDGVLAAFDSPASALRCAAALHEAATALGLELRVGLHVGEVVVSAGDLHGIAVVIAARVVALASGGETLVSRTVRELVAGSGVDFDARGVHELKGVDGAWELFAVRARAPRPPAA